MNNFRVDPALKALANGCSPRVVRLSVCVVDSHNLCCGHRGLQLNGSGALTRHPPGDGLIPKAAKAGACPPAERHTLLWIWRGDPTFADAATMIRRESAG